MELFVTVVGTVLGTGAAVLLALTAAGRWAAQAGREEGLDLVAPRGAGFGYATARASQSVFVPPHGPAVAAEVPAGGAQAAVQPLGPNHRCSLRRPAREHGAAPSAGQHAV